jgi:cytochrome P450
MSVRTSAYRHPTTSTANLPTTSGVRGRKGDESVVPEQSFLSDIVAAEQQTPLPPPSGPGPPKQEAATAIERRFAAVTAVISRWLATNPDAMLQELLDQPAEQMPIFRRVVGPVMVMRHEHVLRCLERTDLFTVDLYAPEMALATDDRDPTAYRHFLLGTDRDELYRLDDLILRRVVTRDDEAIVAALARAEAERQASPVVARYVPLRIVGDYLGVPHQEIGEPSPLPGLYGGDSFPLDDDLAQRFSFTHIERGRVPTAEDLYGWIKDAFRNIFNNPRGPLRDDFRKRAVVANEYLTAYVHALLRAARQRMDRGEAVPDTMLTRLLRLQGDSRAVECDAASLLDDPVPTGEIARRLSDSMIRSNVVGTVVGAVVNPQEATARIVDAMLRLQDGEYRTAGGAAFADAAALALIDDGAPGYAEALERLRRYALEALRLRPQGEVLLRTSVQDTTELGGVLVRKGTPVFVAYAAAMRDPQAVPEPLVFDVGRDERLTPYLADGDRAREAPQSRTYLQHGFGRHKCLGRYASEVTMRESLRVLLRLGPWERRSPLRFDAQGLYAESLRVGVGGRSA